MHDYSDTDDNFELNDDGAARRSEFTVAEDQAGQRLDRFLAAQFPDMSRTHVQTLIDEGRVLVSGIAKKPSHHVESGEQITVEIPRAAAARRRSRKYSADASLRRCRHRRGE